MLAPSDAPLGLGALLLSVVRPGADALLHRALGWARALDRLGTGAPLPLVHDVGLLLATAAAQLDVAPRRGLGAALGAYSGSGETHASYLAAIHALAGDESVERIRALRPSDDVVVAILSRVLDADGLGSHVPSAALLTLDEVDRRLPALFLEAPRDADLAALTRFATRLPRLRVLLDTLDVDTLRLLALVGHAAEDRGGLPPMAPLSGIAQVELLAAMGAGAVQTNDIVSFALELLPEVLETRRHVVPGTFATGGYQGLSRRGSLDSLVLTELAWDDPELVRRLLEGEVLFHARERSEDEASRLHLILVDASASMRGDRTTFARGVAIALAKRLELEGEEVRIRFFDRRLYEPFGGAMISGAGAHGSHRARSNRPRRGVLATALPNLLAFRGERGRSPERVLRQLVSDLDVLRERDRRAPVVHLVTHAAFYAPRPLVTEVHARAALFAVFITPRSERGVHGAHGEEEPRGDAHVGRTVPDLDYLDLLDGYWSVDQELLSRRDDRIVRAREIVRGVHGVHGVRRATEERPAHGDDREHVVTS